MAKKSIVYDGPRLKWPIYGKKCIYVRQLLERGYWTPLKEWKKHLKKLRKINHASHKNVVKDRTQ